MKAPDISVPFVNLGIPKGSPEHKNILSAISDILEGGQFICRNMVNSFEKELAAYCGSRWAVTLNSGTDAIFMSLLALNIRTGDEVIIPANVFWAVANSVVNCGAIPVFADVEPSDMLLSAATIEPMITSRTKAIICVHLTGMPCHMKDINQLAALYHIAVIEDAAQALGAVYNGHKAGSIGKTGCFSFHPLKNIGCLGDGGALVTDDQDVYECCRQLRNHGLEDKFSQKRIGFNSRLDEIQAAVLHIRMRHIDRIIAAKRHIAAIYNSELSNLCEMVNEGKGRQGVYQLFIIQCDKRDDLHRYLLRKGIHSAVHYPRFQHEQAPYQRYDSEHLQVTRKLAHRVLSLPIRGDMSEGEISKVCETIKSFYT